MWKMKVLHAKKPSKHPNKEDINSSHMYKKLISKEMKYKRLTTDERDGCVWP